MIEHLSYSSISLYLDCPEAWRRKYLEGEPTYKTSALAFGTAIHGTIEQMIRNVIRNTQYDWKSVWDEEFGRAFLDVTWDVGEPLLEQYYRDGEHMLSHETVQMAIQSIHPASIEDIEKKVELHVPGVPIPVIGYIDIILDDGTPADFKTSARPWTQDQASGSLQTLFYIAALNQSGFDVNWRFKHFVFVKTKTPQVQIIEHSHTPGELFFLFETIKRVWEGINKEFFPLNPTSWRCKPGICDFYANCRGRYV
jgi:hypothetical protein